MANESGYVPDPREPTTYDVLPGGDLGSGGTGGAGVLQVYYNRNPAPPDDPAYDAISFDANGVITQWIGGGSSWT